MDVVLANLPALFAAAVLIALNALYVFHEFAYVSISPTQLRRIEKKPGRLSQWVAKGVHNLDHYIAVDQLGITATSIGVGWVGQPAVSQLFREPLAYFGLAGGAVNVVVTVLAFSLITGVQMVLGELVPKTISLRYPERMAYLIVIPVELTAKLMHPLVVVFNGIGSATVRLLGFQPGGEAHGGAMAPDELVAVIERSARAGFTTANPRTMRMVLRFSEVEARDIMVPRHAIIGIEQSSTVDEILELGRTYKHARYPVFREDLDHIVGLLNVKELVQVSRTGEPRIVNNWQQLIRTIPALPASASIEELLNELRRTKQEMAILVDEYGGTEGLVTVSSVARYTVGGTTDIRRSGPGRYVVQGQLGLTALETALDLSLDVDDPTIETIGGLIMAKLGRIPDEDDRVEVNGYRLRVLSMDHRRIEQVLLRVPQPEEEAPAEQQSSSE